MTKNYRLYSPTDTTDTTDTTDKLYIVEKNSETESQKLFVYWNDDYHCFSANQIEYHSNYDLKQTQPSAISVPEYSDCVDVQTSDWESSIKEWEAIKGTLTPETDNNTEYSFFGNEDKIENFYFEIKKLSVGKREYAEFSGAMHDDNHHWDKTLDHLRLHIYMSPDRFLQTLNRLKPSSSCSVNLTEVFGFYREIDKEKVIKVLLAKQNDFFSGEALDRQNIENPDELTQEPKRLGFVGEIEFLYRDNLQSSFHIDQKNNDVDIGRPGQIPINTVRAHEIADGLSNWNQGNPLLLQLIPLCIAESRRCGGNKKDLHERLGIAQSIVEALIHFGQWRDIGADFIEVETNTDGAEYERNVIWSRRDPTVSYREGYLSKESFRFPTNEMEDICLEYLDNPWLRHPLIDWVFLDAFITSEINEFGEKIKRNQPGLPGRRLDEYGMHPLYNEAHGNIKGMQKGQRREYFETVIQNLIFYLALPIGAIAALVNYNWEKTALGLFAAYSVFASLYIGANIVTLFRYVLRSIRREKNPWQTNISLFSSMVEVWWTLESERRFVNTAPLDRRYVDVINPRNVRELMRKSQEKGAVWSNYSWAIIERAIEIDPAMLRVDFKSLVLNVTK